MKRTKNTPSPEKIRNNQIIIFRNQFLTFGAKHFIDHSKGGFWFATIIGTEYKTRTQNEMVEIIEREYSKVKTLIIEP